MFTTFRDRHGFALPTVLIASVVLLIVLSVSVSATTAVRNTLKDQYYTQLAQAAGEAGVAMAEACLQLNNNVVTWTDDTPLTPATDCTGTVRSGLACPANDGCWVAINGNVRSSFKVPTPVLNEGGQPSFISQTGYVELWRTSTNTAWRVYSQPQAQSAVAPDLCSANTASTALGWNPAVVTASSATFAAQSTAQPISNSTGNRAPGPLHMRKDFSVPEDGTYTLRTMTSDNAQTYLDGNLVQTATVANTISTYPNADISLTAGCHTFQVVVNNFGLTDNQSDFWLSLQKQGGSQDLVISDTSWRVSSGDSVGFSERGFAVDTPTSPNWQSVRTFGTANAATIWAKPAAWDGSTGGSSGDTTALWMGANAATATSGNNYPIGYNYLRPVDQSALTLSVATEIRLAITCDNACGVMVDGVEVLRSVGVVADLAVTNVTLTAGSHAMGIWFYNNSNATTSGVLFSAQKVGETAVLINGSANWYATNTWNNAAAPASGLPQAPFSLDQSFAPSPDTRIF